MARGKDDSTLILIVFTAVSLWLLYQWIFNGRIPILMGPSDY